ncbi:MAG: malto-oligosyltrehalose trehalohydrolase [Candidatus Thermoplasmatota archaeon]|nr:malto-oligosyltrehalose trehalohydrolase [Candidatus Thermoplasmatota archaeon]
MVRPLFEKRFEIMHGVRFTGGGEIEVNVWAPLQKELKLKNLSTGETTEMTRIQRGYFSLVTGGNNGDRYLFITRSGKEIPDPASRFQPQGIDSPSMMVDTGNFKWRNNRWKTYSMKESVIQEIHVGTYTDGGTYGDLSDHIGHILDTGINTVEIMPLAQTYGSRNWGYDGVFPFAPSYSYGSPEDLKNFVDICHRDGLNVILDVVYNHLGPLGNIFPSLGYYFSSTYRNPWGEAINFDGRGSDEVRSFVMQIVRYWIEEFRMDGLRIDAIHSIYDNSPLHILKEITDLAEEMEKKLGRDIRLIAETDRNDPDTVRERNRCGYGFSGQWNDDFHHAIHCFLSGERSGYYGDYGNFDQIVHAYRNGFVYDGVYSEFLGKTRGSRYVDLPMERLVVFTQNHDQVGNRAFGERPIAIMGERKAILFAVAVLASPFTPMLFMGEEFGSQSPFLFFMESNDRDFAKKVFQGRRDEFSGFGWGDDIPNPSHIETFTASKVNHEQSEERTGKRFMDLYKNLISIRKKYIQGHRPEVWSDGNRHLIILDYEDTSVKVVMSFSSKEEKLELNSEGSMIFHTDDRDPGESFSEKRLERGSIIMQPYSAFIMRISH